MLCFFSGYHFKIPMYAHREEKVCPLIAHFFKSMQLYGEQESVACCV